MRLPLSVRQWLLHQLVIRTTDLRKPDVVIGDDPSKPYLRRWWVIPRNHYFNIYFHNFCRSDDDRALHDHPWWNVSILLRGDYDEVVPKDMDDPGGATETHAREEGDIVLRRSGRMAHRVLLRRVYAEDIDAELEARGIRPGQELDCWTLFITGPNRREWGFWCGRRFVHWRDFTTSNGTSKSGAIGKGCGE